MLHAVAVWGEVHHPAGSFVMVQGSRLWVESEGKGTPLVLVAGGPGLAHDYFHPFFSRFASLHRVIYYDAAGCGRSVASPPFSFDSDLKYLEGLRQALHVRTWSLVGHSYGGMVALAYALEHPEAVDRLILIDSHLSGAGWQASNDALNARIQKETPRVWADLQSLRSRGLRSQSLGSVYRVPAGTYFHRKENESTYDLALRLNPAVYYAIAGDDADFVLGSGLAHLDFRSRIKNLKRPLLVLNGRYDGVVPVEEAFAAKTAQPKARVVILEQSGHFPFIEEARESFLAIDNFLRGR